MIKYQPLDPADPEPQYTSLGPPLQEMVTAWQVRENARAALLMREQTTKLLAALQLVYGVDLDDR